MLYCMMFIFYCIYSKLYLWHLVCLKTSIFLRSHIHYIHMYIYIDGSVWIEIDICMLKMYMHNLDVRQTQRNACPGRGLRVGITNRFEDVGRTARPSKGRCCGRVVDVENLNNKHDQIRGDKEMMGLDMERARNWGENHQTQHTQQKWKVWPRNSQDTNGFYSDRRLVGSFHDFRTVATNVTMVRWLKVFAMNFKVDSTGSGCDLWDGASA